MTDEETVSVTIRISKTLADKMSSLAKDRMVHRNLLFKKAVGDFLEELPTLDVSLSASTTDQKGYETPSRTVKDAPQA